MGALRVLFENLKAASTMKNITLLLGEEHNYDYNVNLPKIVMAPMGGSLSDPGGRGYSKQPLTTEPKLPVSLAYVDEMIDFHCWGANAANPHNSSLNFDQVELVRDALLQALQEQKFTGLYWRPITQKHYYHEGNLKYGRVIIVSCKLEITIADEPEVDAVPQLIDITKAFVSFDLDDESDDDADDH